MSRIIDIIAGQHEIDEEIVKKVIESYIELNLYQCALLGFSETPFGAMKIENEGLVIFKQNEKIEEMLKDDPTDEKIIEYILGRD